MKRSVADAVLERAQRHCEACGWPAGILILHHRQLRQGLMRKVSEQTHDTVENLIAVHPDCHSKIHDHSDYADKQGFIVSQYDDPAAVEVHVDPGLISRRWH